MNVTFWGAAQTVTGSMHELSFNGRRYLLDCGLYQGRRKEARERNAHFPSLLPASTVCCCRMPTSTTRATSLLW